MESIFVVVVVFWHYTITYVDFCDDISVFVGLFCGSIIHFIFHYNVKELKIEIVFQF